MSRSSFLIFCFSIYFHRILVPERICRLAEGCLISSHRVLMCPLKPIGDFNLTVPSSNMTLVAIIARGNNEFIMWNLNSLRETGAQNTFHDTLVRTGNVHNVTHIKLVVLISAAQRLSENTLSRICHRGIHSTPPVVLFSIPRKLVSVRHCSGF